MVDETQAYSPEQGKTREQLLHEVLNPSHSALIVVDMQNDFLDPNGFFAQHLKTPVEQMQSTVSHIQGLIDTAHAAGVPVVFTKGYEDVKFRSGPDLLRAALWEEKDGDGSVNSESGTFGSEFYVLRPEEGDRVVEKHKWSSFSGKDKDGKSFDEILKELGVSTLVVTGVVAETCIETTIRDAYNNNYDVIVPENSVGSNEPEQLEARMKYWKLGFVGNVVPEDFIKESWPVLPKK